MTDSLDLEHFFGRNVSYSAEKKPIYDKLRNDALSPFQGRDMSIIFVYAAVFGFTHDRREALKTPKPQISSVALDMVQKTTLINIAISAAGKDIEILFDSAEANKIVEEYANGGIGLLESELIGSVAADPIVQMSSDMKRLIEEHGKQAPPGT